MNTSFFSKSEGGSDPSQKPADEGKTGGNPRWDTIFRRLSQLESGIRHYPTNTGFLRRSEFPTTNEQPRSWEQVRFVLIDQKGPVAQFKTWAEAFRFMTTMELPGASIVCVEPLRAPEPPEDRTPSPDPSDDKKG